MYDLAQRSHRPTEATTSGPGISAMQLTSLIPDEIDPVVRPPTDACHPYIM